jgi:hypothetical protein
LDCSWSPVIAGMKRPMGAGLGDVEPHGAEERLIDDGPTGAGDR